MMKNPLDELRERKNPKTIVNKTSMHFMIEKKDHDALAIQSLTDLLPPAKTTDSVKLGFVLEKLEELEEFVNKAPNTSYHFQIEKRIRMILDTIELD
jgi:hypothetical protein